MEFAYAAEIGLVRFYSYARRRPAGDGAMRPAYVEIKTVPGRDGCSFIERKFLYVNPSRLCRQCLRVDGGRLAEIQWIPNDPVDFKARTPQRKSRIDRTRQFSLRLNRAR